MKISFYLPERNTATIGAIKKRLSQKGRPFLILIDWFGA
jgi:hypothetical protein